MGNIVVAVAVAVVAVAVAVVVVVVVVVRVGGDDGLGLATLAGVVSLVLSCILLSVYSVQYR